MKAYFQKPIDEEFNDSYSRSGLQPSVGSVQQFRKVEVDRGSAARKVGTSAQVAGATTQAAGATGEPRRERVVEGALRRPGHRLC